MRKISVLVIMFAVSLPSAATAPSLDNPLPTLVIEERGEMQIQADEVSYQPWSSDPSRKQVHVLQYFAGSLSASKIYEPFTDALQETYELGSYHVTTIINLDDALWGTTGFVVSEVTKSKRKFPKSTMVLDENGDGKRFWELGERGAGLVILDPEGKVKFFTREALTEQQMQSAIALVGSYIQP